MAKRVIVFCPFSSLYLTSVLLLTWRLSPLEISLFGNDHVYPVNLCLVFGAVYSHVVCEC